MDGSDRMEDIVNSFLDYLIIDKKYSDNTKKSYEEELKKFILFFKNKKITQITKKDIENFISKTSQEGYESKSIAHLITTLRSFYKYLELEKIITKNPMIGISLPKVKKTLPNVLSVKEVDILLEINIVIVIKQC